MFRKILEWYHQFKLNQKIKKLRKQDPFIYD